MQTTFKSLQPKLTEHEKNFTPVQKEEGERTRVRTAKDRKRSKAQKIARRKNRRR